jgi:Polysaccharide deacetylase
MASILPQEVKIAPCKCGKRHSFEGAAQLDKNLVGSYCVALTSMGNAPVNMVSGVLRPRHKKGWYAMNLISFSIKTKGIHNFARRLWTVFIRFGFSEAQTRRALHTVIDTLRQYNAAPTFFIPAVVLRRHPALLTEIALCGAEIGIHGYIHNDYRTLSRREQLEQTKQATLVFQETQIPFEGFRNPYLGWTEDSIDAFASLNFTYDSNEAILHDVIDLNGLSPLLRSGYEKSLTLFQAMPCNAYTLRPHFEGKLLRIPTSIPDDEMLFDRLRITDPKEVGRIWSKIMQRIYDLEGLYTLNLHPERAVLCKEALHELLSFAHTLPVWLTNLKDIAEWWKERSQFKLEIIPLTQNHWRVVATCTPRATLLARYLTVEDKLLQAWSGADSRVKADHFVVTAMQCPCIGLSTQTPLEVVDFLQKQGYPVKNCSQEKASEYALYLDIPEGLGTTRQEQVKRCSALLQQVEELEAPLLHFGCWPSGNRAALAITGDIDSVTVQDFFLRIIEAYQYS